MDTNQKTVTWSQVGRGNANLSLNSDMLTEGGFILEKLTSLKVDRTNPSNRAIKERLLIVYNRDYVIYRLALFTNGISEMSLSDFLDLMTEVWGIQQNGTNS